MSLSNGVIIWLCASTCFSGAAALKSFDVDKQTPKETQCALCTEGTTLLPDAVFEHNGHSYSCQEAQNRANHPGLLPHNKHLTCVQAKHRWASTCCSTPPEKACQCLNWKETYASGKTDCEHLEFFPFYVDPPWGSSKEEDFDTWDISQTPYLDEVYKGQCTEFYLRLDSTRCNGFDGNRHNGNWCYVSSACSTLNGGHTVNSELSYKHCQRGLDTLFEDMPPKELFKQAWTYNVSANQLAQYAYKAPNLDDSPDKKEEDPEFYNLIGPKFMEMITAEKKPRFFFAENSPNGGKTAYVIYGEEIWKVPFQEPDQNWIAPVCEKGCE